MPDLLIRRRWLLAAVLGITALAVAGALVLSAGDGGPEPSAGPATDVAQAGAPDAGEPASRADEPEHSAGSPIRPQGESSDEAALASDDEATKAPGDKPATAPDEGANTDARLIDDRGRAEPKVVEEEPRVGEDHPGGRGDVLSSRTIEESTELEAANSPHHATNEDAVEESKEIEDRQAHGG
jgi:hypothetical protein